MSQAKAEPFSFGTFEDFLAWEQRQEVRHELVDGVPLAMAGGTEAHDDICFNVQSTLREKLVGGPCKALSPNMPVKTGTMRGRYPDGTVDCGPRHPENRSASCPTVVFEVLSKDSRSDDFTEKLWEYNRIPSIAHYVLLEQTAPHAYIYNRSGAGDFILAPVEIRGMDGEIELPALNIVLPMARAYANVTFPENVDPEAPPPSPSPWRQ